MEEDDGDDGVDDNDEEMVMRKKVNMFTSHTFFEGFSGEIRWTGIVNFRAHHSRFACLSVLVWADRLYRLVEEVLHDPR